MVPMNILVLKFNPGPRDYWLCQPGRQEVGTRGQWLDRGHAVDLRAGDILHCTQSRCRICCKRGAGRDQRRTLAGRLCIDLYLAGRRFRWYVALAGSFLVFTTSTIFLQNVTLPLVPVFLVVCAAIATGLRFNAQWCC